MRNQHYAKILGMRPMGCHLTQSDPPFGQDPLPIEGAADLVGKTGDQPYLQKHATGLTCPSNPFHGIMEERVTAGLTLGNAVSLRLLTNCGGHRDLVLG